MKKKYKILLFIVLILIVFRLLLPELVLRLANKELASMKGYYGQIEDIDISLYRGAYVIDSIYINKIDLRNNIQTPFISAKTIDLSVEWKSLFKGRIVGELEFIDPILKFTKDKTELSEVKKDTADFRMLLKTFMPLKINRFEIKNGKLQYVDKTSKPQVDISMNRTHILATNLSSVEDTAVLPSVVSVTAEVYKGLFELNLKLDALAEKPLFDMNAKIEKTNLPELNDFFKAYANIDINKGTLNAYSEIAAKDGKFTGYVKPVIKDLDVVGPEDRDDKFLDKVWENLVGLVGVIVENRKKDQLATKVPLNGDFGNVEVGTTSAIVYLLRNAFIQALFPSIDHQITLSNVDKKNKEEKGFFKKLFGKEEDTKSNKKSAK
ncbi:MAG TPA: DUF748 domain-containing protein [Bacteroidia bacterium]|nr:DUF748 domain-containing protein [Bacteroidia bacterium]